MHGDVCGAPYLDSFAWMNGNGWGTNGPFFTTFNKCAVIELFF